MEIKNTSNKINFKGVLEFSTISYPRYSLVEKIFKTTPIEDATFLEEVIKVLGDGNKALKLSKYDAKSLFQILKQITDARNLPNYFTNLKSKVISLTRTGPIIIYDDMECFERCGFGGTYAKLDLRTTAEIRTSIRNLILNIIKPLNYVSTAQLKDINLIESRLNNLKDVALVKAESKLDFFLKAPEMNPNDMPF